MLFSEPTFYNSLCQLIFWDLANFVYDWLVIQMQLSMYGFIYWQGLI